MKKLTIISLILLLGLTFFFSSPIQATTLGIQFTGSYATGRTIAGKGNIATGIYYFSLDKDNNGTYETNWSGWCIDPWHWMGNTWQSNLFTATNILNNNGNLFLQHNAGQALQNYRMIGWIYNNRYPTIMNTTDYADFHEALMLAAWYSGDWSLFNFPASGWTDTQEVRDHLNAAIAANAYNTGSLPWLYTPVTEGASQELINPIPEPGTILLLGSGLLGFGVIARYRRRKRD